MEEFLVTVTETELSGAYFYDSDKSLDDIYDAINAGNTVKVDLVLASGLIIEATSQGISGSGFGINFTAKTDCVSLSQITNQTTEVYDAFVFLITIDTWSTNVRKVAFTPQSHNVLFALQRQIVGTSTVDTVTCTVDGAAATEAQVTAALQAGYPVRILNSYFSYGANNTEFVFQSYSGTMVTGSRLFLDNGALKCQVVVLNFADNRTNPAWTETTYTLNTNI